MKIILLFALLIYFHNGITQVRKDDVYPLLKSTEWRFSRGQISKDISFSGCVSGNCSEGVGIYMDIGKSVYQNYSYYSKLTLYNGSFSNNGKLFKGKVYRGNAVSNSQSSKGKNIYGTENIKNEEDKVINSMEIGGNEYFDLTNSQLLEKLLIGEGRANISNRSVPLWEGEARLRSFEEKAKGLKAYKTIYTNGQLSSAEYEFSGGDYPNPNYVKYSGRVLPTGNLLLGKLYLKNGNVYEGFFQDFEFFGFGKMTDSKGKVSEGIWAPDSLLIETPVVFPDKFFTLQTSDLYGDNITNFPGYTEYYGKVENGKPNGWGYSVVRVSNIENDIFYYGKWKNGVLEGPAMKSSYVIPSRTQNITSWAGFFENGIFTYGAVLWGVNSSVNKINFYGDQTLSIGYTNKDGNLEGCGIRQRNSNYDGSFNPEGFRLSRYSNGYALGWNSKLIYSEPFTIYYHIPPGEVLNETMLTRIKNDTNYCSPAIALHKDQYIADRYRDLAANKNAPPKVYTAIPPLFKKGDFLRFKSTLLHPSSGGLDAYVVNIDNDMYKLVTRQYVPAKKTWFIQDVNIPIYIISETRASRGYVEDEYTLSEPTKAGKKIGVCTQCEGTGAQYYEETRTYGGKWEQVNFNTSVKTSGRTVSWKARARCGHCSGEGWKVLN